METVQTFLVVLGRLMAQAAPYVVVGYLVAAVVKEFVPLDVFLRYFGGKGVKPLLRAIGVGALLPICSCGVIPVGIGAFKLGASRGTTLAFMTAGPTISPVGILLAFSMLGPRLALCFIAAAVVGSLAIGFVANRWLGGAEEDALRASKPARRKEERLPSSEMRTFPTKVRAAAKWAFWDLGTDISVDLLLGLCIAAGLLAALPEGWVAAWLGKQSFLTLLYVMVVGIPLYTCTVPSIPIARSLLLLGMSPGAAVTYLISGPATNLGEVNVIRRNLGGRTAIAFVAGLLTLAVAAGLLTDWIAYRGWQPEAVADGSRAMVTEMFLARGADGGAPTFHELFASIPGWQMPFLVVLAAAVLVGLVRRGAGAIEKRRARRAAGMVKA